MRYDVASMSSHVTGKVSLGIIGTTGRWLLPTLLDDLSNQYPDVEIRVIDSTTTALIPLLENGDIDLAVINTPLTHDELTTSPLFEEQLVVVTPSSHPLGKRRRQNSRFPRTPKTQAFVRSSWLELKRSN